MNKNKTLGERVTMRLDTALYLILKEKTPKGMKLQSVLDELVESAMKQRRWIVEEKEA